MSVPPGSGSPRRAVVIGAGIAGLVAARVLADHVDEVVIVDRDELPDGPLQRAGVPQAAHAHVLLRRGYLELRRLYPGFDRRLAERGAPAVDLVRDAVYITPNGEAPRFASSLWSRAASRDLFEAILRELTLKQRGVRVIESHEWVGLMGNHSEVLGVRIRRRTGGHAGEATPAAGKPGAEDAAVDLPAWLVVDASGRSSQALAFLRAIGAGEIAESVVDASLRYATRVYRAPARPQGWKVLVVRDRPPTGTRGGGVFTIEGHRWVVTLGGVGAERPPTDEAGYLDFAASLISRRLHDAIRDAEPLTPVRGWARTANRWRHVERVESWPAGFVVLGDSLCALNPVYGQGMSVAAMEARTLGVWLDSRPTVAALRTGRPPDTRSLVRSLARTATLPWFMATAEDARMPGVQGAPRVGPGAALARRYLDGVQRNVARDAHTLRRFTEVSQLVRPPIALLDPVVAWRVVRHAR